MTSRICYLCGEPGADSKDHVPPKGLLPDAQFGKYQRITVPAHRKCNAAASDDEEYVRDLLVMEAEALGLPKHENLTPRVWRAWARPGGYERYTDIIKTAVPISLRTKGGLFAGKAIGVRPDPERFRAVGRKIVRAMIYHDSETVLPADAEIPISILNRHALIEVRAKDARDPFWIGLSSEHCLHDTCASTVAIRRFYEGHSFSGEILIASSFVIVLWNCVMLAQVTFPLASAKKHKFKFAVSTVAFQTHAPVPRDA